MLLVLAVNNPWQVGPAPSAHPTARGWNVGADLSGTLGGFSPLWGARAAASLTPHERFWTGVELGYGNGWRSCIDCRALGVTWTARGLAVRHRNVNLAGWSVATTVNGTFEWTPGFALEAGTRRVRFDTSWPVWSTWDLLTTLRATPEVGVAFAWSGQHGTRLAVVGLEPAVALTHRIWVEHWMFEATLRIGEEGVGLDMGARFGGPMSRGR
ncbi:hypothetical protein [Enhygromyxa salina]|nr:hypothetical protein [Enhygromyxa salina]